MITVSNNYKKRSLFARVLLLTHHAIMQTVTSCYRFNYMTPTVLISSCMCTFISMFTCTCSCMSNHVYKFLYEYRTYMSMCVNMHFTGTCMNMFMSSYTSTSTCTGTRLTPGSPSLSLQYPRMRGHTPRQP